ncbi:MAG: hypothetical protein V4819_19140, partial [Verrucomicrobiota bacterium]
MRIDIDLDQNDRIISSPGVKDAVRLIQFKRDTDGELTVRFWRRGVQTELAEDAAGFFGVKPAGEFDGELLVYSDEWTLTGEGDAAVYTFTPAFNGAALAALLGSGDGDVENDESSIMAMLEIKWVADGKKHRTQTVDVQIFNDVLKDIDMGPDVAPRWAAPLSLTTPPEDANLDYLHSTGLDGFESAGAWDRAADVNGRGSWEGDAADELVSWTGAAWEVERDGDVIYSSANDVEFPSQVTTWVEEEAGYTPPVFSFIGTAATAL